MVGVLGCVAQLEGESLFQRAPSIDFVLGTKAVGRVADAIREAVGQRTIPVSDRPASPINGENARSTGVSLGLWTLVKERSTTIGPSPRDSDTRRPCRLCRSSKDAINFVHTASCLFRVARSAACRRPILFARFTTLIHDGVREVHLIGQNVNSYRPATETGLEGFPGTTPFSRLLRAVAATGIERVKFTTSFPRDFKPDIVDAIEENENLCNWVHLPVQSGSDRVLKAMRRLHTIDSYKRKIDRIRSSPRHIALTTDIIVGFPGETDEDFRQTVELVEYCGYDSAYIFKYSPRPGTPAYVMHDDVSEADKTSRFLELERVQKEVQQQTTSAVYWPQRKRVAERDSIKSSDDISGHSTCHKVVNFRGTRDMIGTIRDVRITEIKSNSLYGEVC